MEKQNLGIARKFTTMMSLDVLADLTKFAKDNSDNGLGKFSYTVAIRILLERAKFYEMYEVMEERLTELEAYVSEIGNRSEKKKETKEVGTFG